VGIEILESLYQISEQVIVHSFTLSRWFIFCNYQQKSLGATQMAAKCTPSSFPSEV